jgi:hypothetical protein
MDTTFKGTRTKKDILEGVNLDIVKSRFVARNTLEITLTDGTRIIRLHDTNVVSVKNGVYTLNTGGWKTPTTKDRINNHAPVYIYQKNHVWYIGNVVFTDGMRVDENGKILWGGKDSSKVEKHNKAMNKRITKYVNLLSEGNLPRPGTGDCWYCLMQTTRGENLGDSLRDADHLISHLKEGYLHGSILVNAMREAGYKNMQIGFHYQIGMVSTFKRTLKRYLQKRLLKQANHGNHSRKHSKEV